MNQQVDITFITSHPMKADELSWHLDRPVAHHKLDLPEIQSLDPHEVTSFKAREAYRQLNRPVIVEDFSMRFEAQGHLPGPLIKWFLQELKPQGLCKMLDGYESRVAYAQTCFAYCAGDEVRVFDGIMRGVITSEPCGSHGYGIEAIFIPDGWQKTWGQMNKEEQVTSSVRRIGLKKLEAYLKSN
jgi:non-canonical purine NTP pyrophosphatase (RdgB/HAM1 family)